MCDVSPDVALFFECDIYYKRQMTNDNHSNFLFHVTHISHIQVGIHRTMPRLERDISDQEKFINHISEHYDELKNKYRTFCTLNNYQWDDDIFSDTILKCYEAIERKGGLKDTTPYGIESYFFLSFKTNTKREGQYARNMKRDKNIDSDNINDVYENWYNDNKSSSEEKLKQDLFTDWATLYIMQVVEDNFPTEDFYLYRLKTLGNLTYKQIMEMTNEKRVRQRIMDIKNFLKANVRKEDVKELFHQRYNDIL